MLFKYLVLLVLSIGCMCNSPVLSQEEASWSEKFYFDEGDMASEDACFFVHLNNNVWVGTFCLRRDYHGLFSYNDHILKDISGESLRFWRCPYCYRFWMMYDVCKEEECPSKYKEPIRLQALPNRA